MTEDKNSRRDFYVYAFYRDGVPVYIGKGCGKRWLRSPDKMKHNPILHRMILKDQSEGASRITKAKIAENLSEAEALQLEVQTIARVGRRPAGTLVNLTDGGEGASNPCPVLRAQMSLAVSATLKGHKVSIDTREKIRAKLIGRIRPAEETAKATASNKGQVRTAEQRAKFTLAQMGNKNNLGQKRSDETRAKLSAWQLGRTLSPDHVANMKAALAGRTLSPEHVAAMSAARKGKPKSAEHAAKVGAAHRGKPKSEAQKEKQRQAMLGRKLTPEHAAKIGAIHKGRVWSEEHRERHRAAIQAYHRARLEAVATA